LAALRGGLFLRLMLGELMRIYLAARYSRMSDLLVYLPELEGLGHEVTSRWVRGAHDEIGAMRAAQEDRSDLLCSDSIISFTEKPDSPYGRGGRHVEYGIGLALGKRLIVVGYRENVFHYLPEIEFFETWSEAKVAL
jgi:hypothetical protein